MNMTSIMLAMGASQVIGGFAQKNEANANARAVTAEANYNAGVYRQQAKMIDQQKDLQLVQDNRMIRFAEGKHVATTAAKGIEMSGSALAVLNDTMTQMEMDKAIGQYNLDMQKFGVLSQAEATERKGKTMAASYRRGGNTAMLNGIVGGLTTMYSAGAYNSMQKASINTSGGAKIGGAV